MNTLTRAILFCSISIAFIGCSKTSYQKLCFKNKCIRVEIVNSEPARRQGLMFRDSLASYTGMLFVFDPGDRRGIWMKNMRFPIDIIWINQDNTVVDIKTHVPPCATASCEVYMPSVFTKYVLEVNAGFIETSHVKIGDRAELVLP